MNLKNKCDEFLASLTEMRKVAIAEAVQSEVRTKHEPYKAQMIAARDKALANEEQAFNLAIEQLRKAHQAKAQTITADFDEAIVAHRTQVEQTATETAKVEYDTVIRKIAVVADEIK